jgi:DNA-directed RNA polymerase subunit RPC12/RpoP
MTVAERKRKTLEELAAAVGGGTVQGIPCPRCGCRFHRTTATRRTGASLVRIRLCSKCSREFTATERADSHDAD